MTDDETPHAATRDTTEPDLPPGQEIGLRQARTMLGELADRARYLDEVTYLTKNGTKVAAVVPFEAARTRERLRRVHEIAVDEVAAMRADYERLHRAADATLDASEVLWARGYLRVWQALERLATGFYSAVDAEVELALAEERDRPGPTDPDQDGASEEPAFLQRVAQLREQEADRLDFARHLDDRVEELMRADARHPGHGPALDWTGRVQRIERLAAVVAAAAPAHGDFLVRGQRRRLAEALAEVSTMLGEAETTPPAEVPDDVTGYCEKQIWALASASFGGPLMTSMHALAEGLHLSAWSLQRALVELHTAGRVRLYRYFRGYQGEVDPAQLHEKAGFHLVLLGPRPDDAGQAPRPTVIVDL
ncbi:type II toxin-antitoxin system Phd/YefM family antitoxin [Streptosporangium canum]|uniref:type II toxin-antitoxin system Phd/YefM family antitoxin n=1 Tax=Streptosporangium canum TaxID=324952 RepID=UPI003699D6C8